MITACDLRVASTDAFFSIEEINIGMTADVGTLQRLPKLIAPDIATKSPLAIAGIKRNLAYSGDHGVADGLGYIATWNAGMLRGEDLTRTASAATVKKQAVFADLLSDKALAI